MSRKKNVEQAVRLQFAVGDRVRVKAGVVHPDYRDLPWGGWAGEITEIPESGASDKMYAVQWSRETLEKAHPVFRRRCERDESLWEESWILEADLEPDPGGPPIIEQPTQIVTRPLSPDRQADRIRAVFGLTTDDAVPRPDPPNVVRYREHLASQVPFPLEATYVGGLFGRPRPVSVLGIVRSDPGVGPWEMLTEVSDGAGSFICPLLGLEVPKNSPSYQLLTDCFCWLDGLVDSHEDENFVNEEFVDENFADEDDPYEEGETGEAGRESGEIEGEDEEDEEEDDSAEEFDEPYEPPPVPRLTQAHTAGRNDPCPCGSGRKYKKCCLGKNQGEETKAAPTAAEVFGLLKPRKAPARVPALPGKPTGMVYQLKVTLDDTDPPIWRRFQVKDCTLDQLHRVLQAVMGWESDHLYQFQAGKLSFCERYDRFDDDSRDAALTTLSEIAKRKGSRFAYEYDFGDSWWHEIVVEERMPEGTELEQPFCLEGQRACPPEDCGGVGGYYDLMEARENPDDADDPESLEWLGDYDPDKFDAHQVNRALSRLRTC